MSLILAEILPFRIIASVSVITMFEVGLCIGSDSAQSSLVKLSEIVALTLNPSVPHGSITSNSTCSLLNLGSIVPS